MHQGGGGPMGPQQPPQGVPRYQNQGQWNGPPRPNVPPRPGPPNGPPGSMQHRPQMVNNFIINKISIIEILCSNKLEGLCRNFLVFTLNKKNLKNKI